MDKYLYSKIGNNIRVLRKRYGISQLDLALAIGVSVSTISMYETDERVPERDILVKIAKYFRITEHELIHNDFSIDVELKKMNINDFEVIKNMITDLLPILANEKILENKYFKQAYESHLNMCNKYLKEGSIDKSEYTECIKNYICASKENIIEADVNVLWWIILHGIMCSIATPNYTNYISSLGDNEIYISDILGGILDSYNNEDENDLKEHKEKQKRFKKKYENLIFEKIKKLKKSEKYNDLGDYYLAIIYLFDIINNESTKELNQSMGVELLISLSLLDNEYAMKFFETFFILE